MNCIKNFFCYGLLLAFWALSVPANASDKTDSDTEHFSEPNIGGLAKEERALTLCPKGSSENCSFKPYSELTEAQQNQWKALLHYSGDKSAVEDKNGSFFLVKNGRTDPQAEYDESMRLAKIGDKNFRCRYVARYFFLTGKDPDADCEDFSEFKKYVGLDEAFAVFASEDANSPISALGHAFMMIEGVNGLGVLKRYNVGFVSSGSSGTEIILGYLKDSLEGIYTLIPYYDSVHDYITKENRSLWEYRLKLSPEQKHLLYLHIFELKKAVIKYSFQHHNCASGLSKILSAADARLDYPNNSLYVTPAEYLKFANRADILTAPTLRPSKEEKYAISRGHMSAPLKARSPFRAELGYMHSSALSNGAVLKIAPLFSDMADDNLSTMFLTETKYLSWEFGFFRGNSGIRRFDVIKLRRIAEIGTGRPAINFSLSLHGDEQEVGIRLFPDLSAGTAAALRFGDFFAFAEINTGFHAEKHFNLYARPTVGFGFWNESFGKFMFSWERPFSTKKNYSGYSQKFSATYSKLIAEDLSINFGFAGLDMRTKKNGWEFSATLVKTW